MNKVQHPSNNFVLGAPQGWDQSKLECGALAVTRTDTQHGPALVSYWQPTAEELARLSNGGKVALWIFGQMHPPVAVEVDS